MIIKKLKSSHDYLFGIPFSHFRCHYLQNLHAFNIVLLLPSLSMSVIIFLTSWNFMKQEMSTQNMQPNLQNISYSSAPEHGVITFIMFLYHVSKAILMIEDTCHKVFTRRHMSWIQHPTLLICIIRVIKVCKTKWEEWRIKKWELRHIIYLSNLSLSLVQIQLESCQIEEDN